MGRETLEVNKKNLFRYSKLAQMIFQDPYASLDPRMTVGSIIEEGMIIHNMYDKQKRQERVYELLEVVGLNKEHANRFPHEFSGGQRQRIVLQEHWQLNQNLLSVMSRFLLWMFDSIASN